MPIIYHFDWDRKKSIANQRKHSIAFRLATSVFRDPLLLTVYDEDHSDLEERWATIGKAENGQYLVVIHTFQHVTTDAVTVRIISARTANRYEIRDYEEGSQ